MDGAVDTLGSLLALTLVVGFVGLAFVLVVLVAVTWLFCG